MRLGINLPLRDMDGAPLDARGVVARAQMVEAAELDGIWNPDNATDAYWPDPMTYLLLACTETERLEVGTASLDVTIRETVDLAYRLLTLEEMTGGRFTVGVGTGSSSAIREGIGSPEEMRSGLFDSRMAQARALLAGEQIGAANLSPWPSVLGGPPFVLETDGERRLSVAATHYQGWMCRTDRSSLRAMAGAVERYRSLGGIRVIATMCTIDLTAPSTDLSDDDPFDLVCPAGEASERLARLAEAGFDDVLLIKVDHAGEVGLCESDYREIDLEEIRSLVPMVSSAVSA